MTWFTKYRRFNPNLTNGNRPSLVSRSTVFTEICKSLPNSSASTTRFGFCSISAPWPPRLPRLLLTNTVPSVFVKFTPTNFT